MKRTFLVKRNALLSSTDVSWGIYTLAGVILLLVLRVFLPNQFWYIVSPVLRGADALATQSHIFLSSFGDRAALTLENERLTNENLALASENQSLIQKASSLESLLGPAAPQDATGIIAGIIARPPTSPYDTIVVSPGSRAGVAQGEEAFGPGGVPLGVVSAVLADFSRVTLFSMPGMSVNGSIGRQKIPLTIRGAGGGAMRASVGRSTLTAVGDYVFAPGPGLLPIGTVVRIDSDPSSPSVTLQIQPALNIFSLEWVELRATGPLFVSSLSWATTTIP